MKADLAERVKGLVLENADVILVKERYLMERIRKMKIDTKKPVYVLEVSNFDDLAGIDEKRMNQMGWYRK